MEQINKNARNCGTCTYWLGKRQPNRLGFVEVLSKTDSGRCGAKGLNETRQYQAVYCCAKYTKWNIL